MTLRLAGLAIAAVLLTAPLPIHAQDANAAYAVSYIEVAPAARNTARAELRKLRDSSRKEAGNTGFDILQGINLPQQFAILESWSDAKAQAAHAAAATTAQFRDKLKPYLIAPIDERPSAGYAVGPSKAATAGAVYVITHVDFIGPKKDEGLAALKQFGTDNAKETGNLRFDIWQQANRTNHQTLVAAWRGKAAFDKYETSEQTRKFRDALLPMSGSPYDQRLYRAAD
jgi:quinol monooxygenase YgiN